MTILEAAILGAVQGITEFLPVSSDGHLVLAGALFGLTGGADFHSYEILLHMGSLLAIIFVFRHDIARLVYPRIDFKAWGVLLVASLPAAFVGLMIKKGLPPDAEAFVEIHVLQAPWLAGVGLIFSGLLLWTAEFERPRFAVFPQVHGKRAWLGILAIGCAQALAILPGVSRSGSTISIALAFNWLRPEAVRLSFLMGFIAISGAGMLELRAITELDPVAGSVGFASSFVFSLLGLWGLKLVVARAKLRWFAIYCVLIGATALVWLNV